jgi:crotonobetainyl-CoA:carnitine CoA-transferase CaiB-like acyl-CoA transferase
VTSKPLEGVRVLDFTWVRAGPWCTRWLAVLGAEVIKVEWPDPRLAFNGRIGGAMAAQGAGPNAGGHANDQNADKLSITVNVRSSKGLQIIKDLMRVSDVVVENFSASVMDSWGLGYEVMRELKPDIIYVSMAGFGHEGRHASYTTMGPSVQALSGLTFLSGLPDAAPAGWGWSYMDDTGGLYGAMCALAALHHKQATGKGQHVDMSQVAAGITLTGPALLDLSANKRTSRREGYPPGNRAHWPGTPLVNNYRGRTVAPHNAYRTLGGGHFDWCAITCATDDEWQALVAAMGSPTWATDPKFATNSGRLEHQLELDARIEDWTQTIEKYELMGRCQSAGVPAGAVQSTEDRVEHDPQLRARNLFPPMTHPVIGTNPMQQAPFKLSATPVPVSRHGPLLGEHNVSILGGLLGLSWDEIQDGYRDGTLWPSHVPMEQVDYLFERPSGQLAPREG